MHIRGENLYFRAPELSDIDFMLKWKNDPEIEFLGGDGWDFPISRLQQEDFLRRTFADPRNVRWIIAENETGSPVGITALLSIDLKNRKAHTGIYLIGDNVRGKGYGKEAILLMMQYAFNELNLEKLYGRIAEYNEASFRAYVERCGWAVEGTLRRDIYRKGRWFDNRIVSVLRSEFYEKFPELGSPA